MRVNPYPDLAGFADAPGPLSASIGHESWRRLAIDVQSPSAQHAPYEVTNASEYVFVGSIKSDTAVDTSPTAQPNSDQSNSPTFSETLELWPTLLIAFGPIDNQG